MRDQGHHLPLPVGEAFHPGRGDRVRRPGDELADQAAGDGGRQQGVSARDDPQRLQQLDWLGVFEQEPARPGPQGAEDVLVEPPVRDDLPGGLEAVEHRHLNVHQGDVRAVLGGQCDRLPPVGGLGDHLDVVFRFEQRPDAAADQRLVIG